MVKTDAETVCVCVYICECYIVLHTNHIGTDPRGEDRCQNCVCVCVFVCLCFFYMHECVFVCVYIIRTYIYSVLAFMQTNIDFQVHALQNMSCIPECVSKIRVFDLSKRPLELIVIHTEELYVCIHVCMYVRTYVCMYHCLDLAPHLHEETVCVYTCIYVCVGSFRLVIMHTKKLCVCVYVCAYLPLEALCNLCEELYVCMYVCMYIPRTCLGVSAAALCCTRSNAVSLVCLREDTNTITGLSGE